MERNLKFSILTLVVTVSVNGFAEPSWEANE